LHYAQSSSLDGQTAISVAKAASFSMLADQREIRYEKLSPDLCVKQKSGCENCPVFFQQCMPAKTRKNRGFMSHAT